MFIISHKKIFVLISVVLVALSVGATIRFGLPLGIDFKGGAMTQVSYEAGKRPDIATVQQLTNSLSFGQVFVQPAGISGYTIKTRDLTIAERGTLLETLSIGKSVQVKEEGYTSIGPIIGRELARKTITVSALVCLAIILFIAFAFRGVAKPIASWKYGVVAVITLLHDIAIPVGAFALLARSYGVEIDTLFVVALLTILGLSVSDTIVIFDRIRENIKNKTYKTFAETVGNSLTQSITRSINTSLSTIIVLVALAIVGPDATRVFAIMLATGMFFGTYSSIFLASPLLVYLEQWQKNKKV